jgi:hypothetical protein
MTDLARGEQPPSDFVTIEISLDIERDEQLAHRAVRAVEGPATAIGFEEITVHTERWGSFRVWSSVARVATSKEVSRRQRRFLVAPSGRR